MKRTAFYVNLIACFDTNCSIKSWNLKFSRSGIVDIPPKLLSDSQAFESLVINQVNVFVPNVLFLYPLETSENHEVF